MSKGSYKDKERWPDAVDEFIRHHRRKDPATPFRSISALLEDQFSISRSPRSLSEYCQAHQIKAGSTDTRKNVLVPTKAGGPEIPSDLAKDVLNLGNDTCRFPVVVAGREVFCKCKTLYRESYCEEHFAVVYPKKVKR